MIRLILIELKKIFMHKSIYFIYGIIFVFCLFNNIFFSLDYDSDGRYKYEEGIDINNTISDLKKELKKYNVNNKDDLNIYVTTKSKLDMYNDMVKYDKNSWQYIKYNDYMYDVIYNVNYYTYIDKNSDKLREEKDKYNKYVNYFKDNNYKYFIDKEKKDIEDKIKEIENSINDTKDKELINNLNEELTNYKNNLLIINYRINEDINYGNNYLNRALISYGDSINKKYNYDKKKLSYDEKLEYNRIINDIYVNKYIVDNKVNINKENSLYSGLKNISLDYELFIVIIILMISVMMVGDEFNKGTIKLLLVKPYKRNTILVSKIFSGVVVIIMTLLFLIICEFILGGMINSFDSVKMPVVIYDFNIDKLFTYNIYKYIFIKILVRLPMFIFILLFSILLSVINGNNIFSFAVGMIIYSFSSVINNLIIYNNIKILKYVFTLNWDFSNYLFGGISNFKYLSLKSSIFIYVIYVIIILIMMLINFNKKDIKNI